MSGFDKEKWRAQIVDVDFGSTLDEYILVLLERAHAEGRAGAWDEVRDAADGFLDRHWPDAGDRPPSPPAKLIAFMNELAALAAARGTP